MWAAFGCGIVVGAYAIFLCMWRIARMYRADRELAEWIRGTVLTVVSKDGQLFSISLDELNTPTGALFRAWIDPLSVTVVSETAATAHAYGSGRT